MNEQNSITTRKTTHLIATLIIIGFWLVLFLILGAVGGEVWIRVKEQRFLALQAQQERAQPRYYALRAAYRPFAVQHIHPHYLFFFPFDLQMRRALNNDVCRITDDGFRGEGPELAGNRKLAFLLGGSSGFGYLASHDNATITGYLNQLQQEYFFVNAAVPSWNSNQELARLTDQLLAYRPTLVLAYDGANDLHIVLTYLQKGITYPAGVPESFDKLYALVGNIRAGAIQLPPPPPWYERLLPRFTRSVRFRLSPPPEQRAIPISTDIIETIARQYTANLSIMNDLIHARNGRFIGIFQPVRWLHRNLPEAFQHDERTAPYQQFHDLVLTTYRPAFEYLDFATIFDRHYESIPCFDREGKTDVAETAIFLDGVHLYDTGNHIIAREIVNYLQATMSAGQ